MAWNEVNKMEERRKFIRELSSDFVNFSELCREYGISRETGYKWKKRYESEGLKGLKDRRSNPKRHRESTASEVVLEVIRVRNEHPSWGGRTIVNYLKKHGDLTTALPCGRTADRILKRAGLVRSRSRYKRKIYCQEKIKKPSKVNEVWTVDFKGWWKTLDGKRCEPLTIRDEYSKFILRIDALPGTKLEPVREGFLECFTKYGLPDYIRCDNGSPFANVRSLHKLTKLSAWWIKLGITPNRIPPASPQYNGGHERMHRDIKRELQSNPASDLKREQKRFEAWRHDFNHIRPHQALDDLTPSQVYKRATRRYKKPGEYVYPAGFEYRKICPAGDLFWKNNRVLVTKALVGEHVGINTISKDLNAVWYRDFYLGVIDMNNHRKVIPDVLI